MPTPSLPEAKAAFSRALKIELKENLMLFISGTAIVAPDESTAYPGDRQQQTIPTYENIRLLLNEYKPSFKDV